MNYTFHAGYLIYPKTLIITSNFFSHPSYQPNINETYKLKKKIDNNSRYLNTYFYKWVNLSRYIMKVLQYQPKTIKSTEVLWVPINIVQYVNLFKNVIPIMNQIHTCVKNTQMTLFTYG